MSEQQQRCPFCESAIPREALYCSRCGGKIPVPRGQGTAPGLAPQSPTPPSERRSAPPPGATPPEGRPSRTPAPQTARSGDSMVGSQSMSISRIQRPGRGLKIALFVLGGAVLVALGWIAGRWQRPEPIAAVPAPAIVELGQPRVAVGADLPDPGRFLAAGADGGASSAGDNHGPARPHVAPVNQTRPDGRRTSATDGGPTPPSSDNHHAQANAPDGGASPPANGNASGGDSQSGSQAGQEGEGEDDGAPEGQLDTRAVIYVVRHYLPQVRACYERQLRNEPELRGQITMRFTVGAGGHVTDASPVVNSTGSDTLAACVSSNLRTWRFPEPEGGPVSFEYPFRFGSPTALPELPGATQDP